MNEIRDNELRFVARHYKEGRMNVDKAWQKYQATTGCDGTQHYRRWGVAAAILLSIGLAVACIVISRHKTTRISPESRTPVVVDSDTVCRQTKADTVKVFHFDNTPIKEALQEVSAYYGCSLTANDTTQCVSGDISATSPNEVADILETTLGIEIERK